MPERSSDTGRFEPDHDDVSFLNAVESAEPAGTVEVAEIVGCRRQNADYRLRKLEEQGKVNKKKVGRTLVWTLPGGGR